MMVTRKGFRTVSDFSSAGFHIEGGGRYGYDTGGISVDSLHEGSYVLPSATRYNKYGNLGVVRPLTGMVEETVDLGEYVSPSSTRTNKYSTFGKGVVRPLTGEVGTSKWGYGRIHAMTGGVTQVNDYQGVGERQVQVRDVEVSNRIAYGLHPYVRDATGAGVIGASDTVKTFTIAKECDQLSGQISKTLNITWSGTLVSAILQGQVANDFIGVGNVYLSVQVNGNEVQQVQPQGGALSHGVADVSGIHIESYLLQGANNIAFVWMTSGPIDIVQTCGTVEVTMDSTGSINPPPPPSGGGLGVSYTTLVVAALGIGAVIAGAYAYRKLKG